MSQDEYVIGLAFVDFENGSERLLEKFIRQTNGDLRNRNIQVD
jgi:hypothetical protein